MPALLELLLLLLALLVLALLFRPPPRGLAWAKARLKGLLDWEEVEGALRALEAQEKEVAEALEAPHLLPETREELKQALRRIQEWRQRVLALLESLAAERTLARGDLEAARRLEARLEDLREVLASLRAKEG